jgi:hypothetical protein
MSRPPRRYLDWTGYAYGVAHLQRFPEQYKRLEHRFKLADIDWCEFCGYCHRPVTLCEMYRGGDLNDKSTTVMSHLARGEMPVYAFTPRFEWPPGVEQELDQISKHALGLVQQSRLTEVSAQRRVSHRRGGVETMHPDKWWEAVAFEHGKHHQSCAPARAGSRAVREELANPAWLDFTELTNPLFRLPQVPLIGLSQLAAGD